ncbi:MAG: translation initiation factor IF-2 [Planctomycetota bacterium]|jgi:translation initiation factor IF-2|nr:translation initiation factor IF-2 [Planctomycetota bacterium]
MRLHELAKKHGYNQQDLLAALRAQNFDVKDPLASVDGEIEKWVTDQAKDGWTPLPPDKGKTIKKKKVVVGRPPAPVRPPEEERPDQAGGDSRAQAGSETPPKAPAKPEPAAIEMPLKTPIRNKKSKPAALDKEPAEEAKPIASEAGRRDEPLPAASPPEPTAESQPEKPASTAPTAKPELKPIKRVANPITGGGAVGKVSGEILERLKRTPVHPAKAGKKTGDARSRDDKPRDGRDRDASPRRKPPITGAQPPEDAAAPGKPIVKHRVKTKIRSGQDAEDRDVVEKRAKAAKRPRSNRDDWGMDDLADGGDDYAAAPEEGAAAIDVVAPDILSAETPADRMGAGFKHKRADFKSKRIRNELPASFAEIDNEFTRSIAGGGRRRSSRGGRSRTRTVGRRSRTRRIAQPIPRVPGQEAVVRLGMTIRDISIALGVKLQEILAFMLSRGDMIQVNDIPPEETIVLIAEKFKIPLKWETEDDLEEDLAEEARRQTEDADAGDLAERPPVITFMGHVDHGKTSLLDAIRNTRVVDGEHGGITQHIGAYSVLHNGKRITFLDTPGHEAFSAMRARGANLTDIAVLVVAADDGVMPQTEEAAAHAKNANVPTVIAINKCDLPSANPDRVRQELANRLGLLPEEWGGKVGMINVSAHTRQGIDNLLERILLEAELLELRANPNRPAAGFVVEAQMSEGQGVIATLLVKDGTLRTGDVILSSNGYGKIRFMFDEFGRPIESAGPGMPVRASGLSAVPEAGDKFFILSDILKARAIAEQRERESRAAALAKRQHVTLENLTSHLAGSGKRELSVIVKADVAGSLEVIEKTLRDMATSEVGINIIHAAVGGVNHADVILADASDAIVLGFHVVAESQARSAALSLGVQIRTYHVIYRMIEDMRAALEGLLPPEEKEVVQGHVEIRQVFRSSKIGAIAGCYVSDGLIQRTSRIRLFRNQVMIYEGGIQSLRRVRDDIREVKAGFECGIKIAGYDGIEEGDLIEAFAIEEIARKL